MKLQKMDFQLLSRVNNIKNFKLKFKDYSKEFKNTGENFHITHEVNLIN